MKKVLQILLIVSILVCFSIFLKATDAEASFRLIKQLGFYSVFILVITFFAGLAGAASWRYCIGSHTKPSLTRLFMIRQTGNTITMFNPTGAIAGELFNARMLIGEGVEKQIAYKSVLLMRTLMILSQFLLFSVVLVQFVFLPGKLSQGMRLAVNICFPVLLLAASVLLFLLLRKGKITKTGLKKKKRHILISQIEEMRFLLAAHIRLHFRETAIAFLLFSVQWISGALELFFILHFSYSQVNIWDSLFMDTLIIVLKSTVTFIPGQLGAEELINKFTLQLLGIASASLWLSVSILRRARQLCWSGMALFFYIQLKGGKKLIKSHGDTVRQS
jgi:hypothetical protein